MKKNSSGNSSNSGETFPVDTLGIPILVDVVESAPAADAEDEIGILVEKREAGPNQAGPLDPGQETATEFELPAEVHLDQITEKIARSVTEEIMAALEPLVRDKVNLALRQYEDGLLKLPGEESEKKPESI